MKRNRLVFWLLTLLILLGGAFSQPVEAITEQGWEEIRAFQNVAPGQGWLWWEARLFWTDNDGQAWQDITPTRPGYELGAVFFDKKNGRALLTGAEPGHFALANRVGQGWAWSFLEFPEIARWPAPAASVKMGWQNERLGWLTFKMATGNNFSVGLLYLTTDGGQTWRARPLPVAGDVVFADERIAWLVGGVLGRDLYLSRDGGQTWEAQEGGLSPFLPVFVEQGGWLPLLEEGADSVALTIFSLDSDARYRTLAGRAPLSVNLTPGIFIPSWRGMDGSYLFVVPSAGQIIQLNRAGQLTKIPNEDGHAARIVAVEMADLQTGWASWADGACLPSPKSAAEMQCTRQAGMLVTHDGGRHWQEMPLPGRDATVLEERFSIPGKPSEKNFLPSTMVNDPDTQPYNGQGFDTCQIPALDQMQTWWNASPYSAVNLYIGGSSALCKNTVLTASYLEQLNAQGWRFIPTWVGPQAPCTGFQSTFDWDPAKAYTQGINQANQALVRARELGLTDANQAGTVIYYDMEAYNTGDSACRAAVNAFVHGWTKRMQELGNLAGVYGASCASAVSDWSTLNHVPDSVWIANWYGAAGTVSYRRTASVWNTYCVSNTLWANHQRLRQYAGDHGETWGGLTFPDIDSDVLDGTVTVPNGSANQDVPSQPILVEPAEGSTLERSANIWLGWKTNGDACALHVWGPGLDATDSSNCSLYNLGVLKGGAYSWQVTASNGAGSTLGPIWHFNVRPAGVTNLSAIATSQTTIDLQWTISADEPEIDGYRIYLDGTQVAALDKGISAYRFDSLACGTRYAISVQAIQQGIESNDLPVTVRTSPCEATFQSLAEFDGWVRESGEMTARGGAINVTNPTFWLGDDAFNRQYRAILHFDTSTLPDDAILVSAILKIKQYTIVGVNPFTTHRNIAVDIRSGYFFTDPTLQLEDFQALADKNRVALIKNSPANRWYSATLDTSAFPFINLVGPTQFRLRFALDDDNDFSADYIKFFSGNATETNRPVLVIQYNLP